MVEVTYVPRVKTETATIHSPISKCGDNWWREVRIRAPYKGVNNAFRTLPSLGDPSQIEKFDAGFIDEISVDLERIRDFAVKNSAPLNDRQRKNIDKMLKRAVQYISDARTIQRNWKRGFSGTRIGKIPPWPLGGQPQGGINASIEEGYVRDSERWKKLVRAALRNARCAEEVAKKATIRDHNKGSFPRIYGETSPPVSATASSASWNPPIRMTSRGLTEEESNSSGESEVKKKVKKKDNTLLFAGAAAIGLVAVGKK